MRALHNMIVEDEKDTYARNFNHLPSYNDVDNDISQPELDEENFAPFEIYSK